MKKILLLLCLASFIPSCTSFDGDAPETVITYSTIDRVTDIALKARSEFFAQESRGYEDFAVSSINFITGNKSRSTDADTLLYIVNFAGNKGSAVVSSGKSGEQLLAVTDNGRIEDIDLISNPGLKLFMNKAKKYADSLPDTQPYRARIETKTIIDTLENIAVWPRIRAIWGQKDPLGGECPNGIAGCGPTAAALVLSYLQYPTSMIFTYPERKINSCNFDW